MRWTVLLLMLSACTAAERAKIGAYGTSAHITCYSGTTIIYDGNSDGKVLSEEHSDGYYFRDKADGKLKEVSGNCVIIYG